MRKTTSASTPNLPPQLRPALLHGDIVQGLTKPLFSGFIIATGGPYFGLKTTGGTQGVGKATTQAVVVSAVFIIIVDLLVTRRLLHLRKLTNASVNHSYNSAAVFVVAFASRYPKALALGLIGQPGNSGFSPWGLSFFEAATVLRTRVPSCPRPSPNPPLSPAHPRPHRLL